MQESSIIPKIIHFKDSHICWQQMRQTNNIIIIIIIILKWNVWTGESVCNTEK